LRETFDFSITYHQLVVFDVGTVAVPDKAWTMRHIEQGFSWRPGCVTFETLEDSGALRVEVLLADDLQVSSESTRAIVVPFGVSAAGAWGCGTSRMWRAPTYHRESTRSWPRWAT